MIRAESEIKLVRVNDGEEGANGTTFYTWIKYADTPTSGMSDNPTGKVYIGIAYNKTTATESTQYSDYSWSLIKGDKGDTGAQGETGVSITLVTRYYQLSEEEPELPDPAVSPPGGDWQGTEPPYQSGNTSLWYVDVSVFSDDSVQYSDIGRAYSYQVVSDTRALAQTINENYIRWDASHNRLINKDAEDVIEKYTSAYMKFTQTTGNDEDPLLLLGDLSNGFVTAISNRGMRFYQNTPIDVDEEGTIDIEDTVRYDMEQPTSNLAIAYFDDNQMKINRGVVVDRLQVGGFRWDSGDDGSLTFRWVGGN